jgi:hypothetical protein
VRTGSPALTRQLACPPSRWGRSAQWPEPVRSTSIAYAVAASSTSRCQTRRTRPAPRHTRAPPAPRRRRRRSPGVHPTGAGGREHDDVGLHRRRIDAARCGRRQGVGRPAGPGVVVGEPVDVVVEGMQPSGREDPDLTHPAAVALAPDPGLGDRVGRADEHRPDGRAQPLGQAHRDGVELTRHTPRGRHPRRRGRSTAGHRPGAWRTPRGWVAARSAGSPTGLHGAAAEVVGVLDDDQRRAHLVGPNPGLQQRERPAGRAVRDRRPGARGDPGEDRRGAELGPHDVGEAVADELPRRAHVQSEAQLGWPSTRSG